jgi:ferredoxin-NADP reductase/CRP-like cAMP-binding protein/cytochrome P450
MTMSNATTFLSRCGLFRGFDDARLAALGQALEEAHFPAGASIFREGDSGDAMFVVLGGAVQVYAQDRNGRDVTLARLEEGEYFGEQALLPGGSGRRNAGVRAVDPVRLARLPKAAFQSALAQDDALRERLVEIGENQLRHNLQELSPLARGIGLHSVNTLRRRLAAGEVLFRQGDEADALYFVGSGRLAAWREDDGGRTLIGYIEKAGCVGELALLKRDRRSATVSAEEPTEVVAIPRSVFDEAYSSSPAVRDHLATLQRAYELPQRGVLTQHTGKYAGQECITTLYHLRDGSVVAAYRVIGQALYSVERLGAAVVETLTWKDGARSRELRLDASGIVLGLTARGDWPEIQNYHLFVLDGGRIGPTERSQFARTGAFDLPNAVAAQDAVCHCMHVSEETLRAAIRRGATTFTRLQQATGCGTVCGGCVPAVAEMLGTEDWVLADVVAETDEAAGIRSFELVPRDDSYPEASPGQHIVVEGVVGGLRLRRPYTLSSARQHGGRLRITVKREAGGAFSPWLFDGRPKGEPLRITRPRGEYIIDLTRGPTVCLVAGIGVTPAVSAVSTAAGDGRNNPLVVHYSGRDREVMACIPELETAAGNGSSIELILRETSRQGRIGPDDVAGLAGRFPNADWYLCGPENYLREVGQLLKEARVAGERIHVETFTPVGAAPVFTSSAEERSAVKQYLLVPPEAARKRPVIEALRALGRMLVAVANNPATDWQIGPLQLNPLRALERRFARAAGIDSTLPLEHIAIVSALARGAYDYQLYAFERRPQAGDTFTYVMPSAPFPKMPQKCRVDTGWSRPAPGKVAATYVTRSRTAIEHLLRRSESSDRGALPYHFLQQVAGRMDVASCPGQKVSGVFAGQFHDNATWTDDRAFAVNMFSFEAIDSFVPVMAAALEEVCQTVDEVRSRQPEAVIDLNVLCSKIAYTIIVRLVFGDVDLAEMHGHGHALSESSRDLFNFVFEYVLGRQSAPPEYIHAQNSAHGSIHAMIDLIRDLHRQGKLTEAQRAMPTIRLMLETADSNGGAHERLYTLMFPLIIAGHETTGHALSWAIYELNRHPEIGSAVLAEIDTFRLAHAGKPLSTADYDERPLTWALFAEVLRRHGPVEAVPRTTTTAGEVPPDPDTNARGFRYPADAMFVFSIIGVHLDPRRWPDPYEFRLDRWLTEIHESMSLVEKGRAVRANIRAREQALDWLPFADGPGRCPGAHFGAHEFILVLDTLLSRYRFELVKPDRNVGNNEAIVVGPETGALAVRIRPRKERS